MFEVNHDDAQSGNSLMKEGDYEIIVKQAFENATKGGTVYISIPLIVRNDVDQQYKNKHIFHSVWKSKDTGEYNTGMLNTICKALKIPNGTKFKDLEELLAALVGKTAMVTIKHKEYNGEKQENVAYWNETKFPECKHVFKNNEAVQTGFFPVESDDDLPF